MNTALDEFELTLIKAARALRSATTVAPLVRGGHERRRPLARRLALAVPTAWLVAACAAAAGAAGGTGYFIYRLLQENPTTETIASFTCDTGATVSASVQAVTGDPLVDCAAVWPSATAGRESAPPLTAWAPSKASFGAVVQPTAAGAPSYTSRLTASGTRVHFTWHRLPIGWTVNLTVVELTDQLNDLPSKTINGYGPLCTYASRAIRLARSLIAADHASGWRVSMSATTGALSPGCRPILDDVDARRHTVRLGQLPTEPRPNFSHLRAAVRRQDIAASKRWSHLHSELVALQARTNTVLNARCSSVADAAALWVHNAAAVGIRQTTLAYYRYVNAHPPAPSSPLNRYYTLFRQPASQHTGSCAHILVLAQGGGSIDVYAARIRP
ncbi:MAG TPA: hypothetical protein VHM72_02225 [Solirubrobacteraceae bacterium]|nr:hypothetical protein [Solirubrobacteraceae bacterium]